MSESKYLQFELGAKQGKTDRWLVSNKHHGHLLGIIKWFGPWRQYCFFPEADVVFNSGCMDDISEFIKERMRERRER